MAVFIDTGALVAARNADDKRHERAKELLKEALEGKYGTIYTSDYVINEATTLALVRTGDPELAVDVGEFALESPRIRILQVERGDFKATWEKFKSFVEKGLSFTDCSTIHLMEKNRIEKVMSFDSDFDGLVERMS